MPKKENTSYNFRQKHWTQGELIALRKDMVKTANRRLSSLEKAERDFWAYDYATLYTQRVYGSNRFSAKSDVSTERVIRDLEELQKFLNSKSSTVGGSKDIDNKILRTFERKGVKVKNPREFFNFLSSSTFKALSNRKVPSEFLIDYYSRASENGKSEEEIEEELEKYRRGEVDGFDELVEKEGYTLLL